MVRLNRTTFSRKRFLLLLGSAFTAMGVSSKTSARPLSVRVNRWLELRNYSGTVDYLQNGQWRRAQSGQRLGSVGQGVRTGYGSLARLAVDTGIGLVSVSENTDLRVTQLYTTQRGGKVTELNVSRGQARMFVRPFTNPDSRFEIRTPSGVNGVRGTDFGVVTQPSGRSALAVLEGSVASSAQGQSVAVEANYQNLIFPGEPPSAPEPLVDDPSIDVQRLDRQNRHEDQTMVLLEGQTSPYNLFIVEGETQNTGREGDFSIVVPLPLNEVIEAKVITPSGTVEVYDLVVP